MRSVAGRCFGFSPDGEVLSERHLQALWYDREMRPPRLKTSLREEVRVIDPGEWNLEEGPDFKNAVLEIGRARRRLKGDVEIHLRPGDWTAHAHGSDGAYRNVIAHVTWTRGQPPPTLPDAAVSIALGEAMATEIGFSPEQIDLTAYPFARLPNTPPPCQRRIGANPELAHDILSHAGILRLRTKARRFAALLSARPQSREQVFYEEVMAALGYRRNAQGFRFVAGAVPYRTVVSEPETAEHALLTAAGFVEWDRRRVRPNNSPERRLRAAAGFFAHNSLSDFMEAVDFSPQACRRLAAKLSSAGRLGRGRANAILANVIVPMALAEQRLQEVPAWLPPEDVSTPMRLAAFRLFGRDHNPHAFYATNGLWLQGLLKIHRDYCLALYPDCTACPVAQPDGFQREKSP